MQKRSCSPSGLAGPRAHAGLALGLVGILLGVFSLAATSPPVTKQLAVNSTDNGHLIDERSGPEVGKAAGMPARQHVPRSPAPAGWSLVSSPNNSTLLENKLFGVTCASASECWAIGVDNASQTFIEQWNGS